MALGQSLRYYRQQFNPENAFENATGGSPIISMYNPQQGAQLIEAASKRQERFDVTTAAVAAEKARIGEMDTYDLPELNKRLKAFEGSINDLVQSKYNGDYSAAANEIAKMIGTERTNPFYHFNKQKVEMSKAYLDAKMKLGSNFMSVENPMAVSFEEWQNGKTFDFTPVNREDIVKQSAVEFSSLADTLMSDPQLKSTAGGQYFLSIIQSGIKDPAALRAYLASEPGKAMIDNIVAKNPILAQLPQEQVMGAIFEGAHSAIGKTQTQLVANQGYLDALQMARLAKVEGQPTGKLVQTGLDKMPLERSGVYSSPITLGLRNSIAAEEAKKYGVSAKSFDELYNAKGRDARQAYRATKERVLQEYTTKLKDSAVPVLNINRMWGKTSGEMSEINNNVKAINNYINETMPEGTLIGINSDETKKLEDLTDKEVHGISLIPTGVIDNPFIFKLQITGTPPSKGTQKAKPISVDTLVSPENSNANLNIFKELVELDPGLRGTLIKIYKDIPGSESILQSLQ